MSKLTQQIVLQLFNYNPDTGLFTWKIRVSNNIQVGQLAGCQHKDGYWCIIVKGKQYGAHRLAWLYTFGRFPSKWIDHINGVRSDNRLSNLRESTPIQNGQNQRLSKRNKLGLKGVYSQRGKFHAKLIFNKKKIYLGTFNSPQEAHAAYTATANKLFGEFARSA